MSIYVSVEGKGLFFTFRGTGHCEIKILSLFTLISLQNCMTLYQSQDLYMSYIYTFHTWTTHTHGSTDLRNFSVDLTTEK